MKLYNQNKDKIEDVKVIPTTGGTLYADKTEESTLNANGYYKVEYSSTPDRRYYTYTSSAGLIGNKFVVGYNTVKRSVDEVKERMIKDWSEYADKKEAAMTVVTSVGIEVKANAAALTAFSIGAKRGKTYLRDKNYQKHTVTPTQMQAVYDEIEDNADAFFDLKGDKFDEIMALTTVQACIDYENFTYDYTVTQADVDADPEGTLTVGQIIQKTKNKVKDW